jgi:uncharacterized protein (DUF924 family)
MMHGQTQIKLINYALSHIKIHLRFGRFCDHNHTGKIQQLTKIHK